MYRTVSIAKLPVVVACQVVDEPAAIVCDELGKQGEAIDVQPAGLPLMVPPAWFWTITFIGGACAWAAALMPDARAIPRRTVLRIDLFLDKLATEDPYTVNMTWPTRVGDL